MYCVYKTNVDTSKNLCKFCIIGAMYKNNQLTMNFFPELMGYPNSCNIMSAMHIVQKHISQHK